MVATTGNPLDDTIIATLEFNSVTVAAAVFAILTHFLPDAGYLLGQVPHQQTMSVVFVERSVRQIFDELARLADCTWTVDDGGVIEFASVGENEAMQHAFTVDA